MIRDTARMNIYLDDPDLRRRVRVAAARQNISISEFCQIALEKELASDGARLTPSLDPDAVERWMEDIARRFGPVGVSAAELVEEGRRERP